MDAFFNKFSQIPLIQKIAGFMFLCAITVAVYFFFFQSSTEAEIEAVNQSIIAKKAELSEIQQTMIKIKEYEAEAKRLEKKLEEALSLLPEQSEIPKLLEKVANLAEKSGLAIDSFKPLGELPEDFYVKVPIDLNLRGSFFELMNFFDAISKLRRVVNITEISLEREFGGSNGFLLDELKTRLKVHCLGVTFRFGGAKGAAPAAAPAAAAPAAPAPEKKAGGGKHGAGASKGEI